MPVLPDAHHERFAQLMAEKRVNNAEAYRRAVDKPGMTTAAASLMANKWIKQDKIVARIEELQAKAAERCSLTRKRYIESLAKMYEARPEDASMSNPLCDVLITRGQKHAVFQQKLAVGAQLAKVVGWERPTEVKVEAGENLASFLGRIFTGGGTLRDNGALSSAENANGERTSTSIAADRH